jgi:large subunit ribosomal protein L13
MEKIKISQKQIEEKWYLIDAKGHRIGRIATLAAELLLGKNNPLVRKNLQPNAHVVVINAGKIDFTPKRGFSKFYKSYSGYSGGLSFESLEEKFEKNKTFPIENAVKGMLPKNKRGNAIYTNLRVYEDDSHPHEAQKPEKIDISVYKL